jgi:MFS family permease
MSTQQPISVESRASWIVACAALGILTFSYGGPLVAVVALKPIAAELGVPRSVPALAFSLAWLGTGIGGIIMGRLADRTGLRPIVMFGAAMVAAGLAVSSLGGVWHLYIGQGLLMGLLGNSCLFAPLVVYVSRWFDRRRGSALALISSGQYIAGIIWPSLFQHGIASLGYRETMLLFGLLEVVVILPVALIFLRSAPEPLSAPPSGSSLLHGRNLASIGLSKRAAFAVLAAAPFFCCVPMAIPNGHLVAFCSDLGIPASHGAAMLSVMLACAFFSRQFWGWFADRFGGLRSLLVGSGCQALALAAFLTTQDEVGLFAVAGIYGLGFAGLIPAYVLTVRELFPASEASWRVPVILFSGMGGMAFGAWMAGAIYDYFGFYAPAFATGVLFNVVNFALIGTLVLRSHSGRLRPAMA